MGEETTTIDAKRASGPEIALAMAFHFLLGGVWLVVALTTEFSRYAFCSNDPEWLSTLLLTMGVVWLAGAALVGWVRSRANRAWPLSVGWCVLWILVYAVAVMSGPDPAGCGIGFD